MSLVGLFDSIHKLVASQLFSKLERVVTSHGLSNCLLQPFSTSVHRERLLKIQDFDRTHA